MHVAGSYDGGSLRVYTSFVERNAQAYAAQLFTSTTDLSIGLDFVGVLDSLAVSPIARRFPNHALQDYYASCVERKWTHDAATDGVLSNSLFGETVF